jgi:dTDP-4-amino-4,6-dideoxygalactose transaminase
MERIDRDIEKCSKNADYLGQQMKNFPFIELLKEDERVTRNSLHLFVFKYKAQGLKNIPRDLFIKALQAENVTMVGNGYSEPIYKMQFLYSDAYRKMTGRVFTSPQELLPNNEVAAHQEGCWMYHSSLLGEEKDMDAIVEAMAKIEAASDELARMMEV